MIIALILTSLVALGEGFVILVAMMCGRQIEAELLATESDNDSLRHQNYELKLQCQKLETRLTKIGKR